MFSFSHWTVTSWVSNCNNSIGFKANARFTIACLFVLTAVFCSFSNFFCFIIRNNRHTHVRSKWTSISTYQIFYLVKCLPMDSQQSIFLHLHQTWTLLPFHSLTIFFLHFLRLSSFFLFCSFSLSLFALTFLFHNFLIMFVVLVYTLWVQTSQALNKGTSKYVRGLLNFVLENSIPLLTKKYNT